MTTRTYKGEAIIESYQTKEHGWDSEDAYYLVIDPDTGREKYIGDSELDEKEDED